MMNAKAIHDPRADVRELTVADALVGAFADWSIGHVYGVSGANIEHFHDAIHRHQALGIRSVMARSENGAAFMADVHARKSGQLAVCCATSGGGMMNLSVGLAESFQSAVPVLAVIGQPARVVHGKGGFQDSSGIGRTVDAATLFASMSKCVLTLKGGEGFWDDLLEAVRAALSRPQGPAVLLVPRDVFSETVPARPANWPERLEDIAPAARCDLDEIRRLGARISRAKRPVIIAGEGVRRRGALKELTDYARAIQCPVVTTMVDVATFPHDDPLFLGSIGVTGHPSAHDYIVEEADLLLAFGTQMEVMVRGPIERALPRLQLSVVTEDPAPLACCVAEADVVTGSMVDVIRALKALAPETARFEAPSGYELQHILPRVVVEPGHEAVGTTAEAGNEPLLASHAIMRLSQQLPARGTTLFDAGNGGASALHYMQVPHDNQALVALGMGGMGYAIAGAIGAQLASSDGERTTVVCGDGAFLMLGMEVHTAVEWRLPIVFVVLNNGQHGMCVTRQDLYFEKRREATQYPMASIAQIARGFGTPDELLVRRVETNEQLELALSELQNEERSGPAVIEIVLRQEEYPPFAPLIRDDTPLGALVRPNHPSTGRKVRAA